MDRPPVLALNLLSELGDRLGYGEVELHHFDLAWVVQSFDLLHCGVAFVDRAAGDDHMALRVFDQQAS